MAYRGVDCPPKFDRLNFPIWKVKIIVFFESLGSRVAKAISKQFVKPDGDEDTWSETTVKDNVQKLDRSGSDSAESEPERPFPFWDWSTS